MKKLLLLGGSYVLLPIIKKAHDYGWYVITMDYLPENLAHKYSDEYSNLSVIDQESVLTYARTKKINAISSFGCDAGAVTAAYVAEQMGLPFVCSYQSACILQDKGRFREFLRENNFNVPRSKRFTSTINVEKELERFNWPVIVKPVDSAGSKGVTKCDSKETLPHAIEVALTNGHNGAFIIEEFLEKEGMSSGSETFFVDGEAVYNGIYDQFFDPKAPNPYVPAAECWPSSHNQMILDEVYSELNRLAKLLQFRFGLMNIEWRVSNGRPYLMEVTPRAGGNRLAEMLCIATDSDVIDAEVRQILGMSIPMIHKPHYKGCFANLVLHANETGKFSHIEIKQDFRVKHIIEEDLWVHKGDCVEAWSGGNHSIGILFLKFITYDEMMYVLSHVDKYVNVIVSKE